MAQINGKKLTLVPRIPYVPIEPWDWFKENGLEDKGGGGMPMGEGPTLTPSIHIKDGALTAPPLPTVYGGTISNATAEDLRIVSYDGYTGGIYVEGADSDYTVNGAVISLSGNGEGLGEQSAGAGVSNHAHLTLHDCLIDCTGASRTCTSASNGSVLRVYDSALISHGAPFGPDSPDPVEYRSAPAPLEIRGNNRTHCTVQNSYSYFYRCLVTADGWAALSTDASAGYVYLEANDCKVVTTKSGYGAYADWGCHDVFNRCKFDVASQGVIMAGEASVRFTDSTISCGTYLALIHCVMGRHTEVGELTLTGCQIKSAKHAIEVRSQNAVVTLENCTVETDGALMHTMKNTDPHAAIVNGRPTPGDELHLISMEAKGDILHEDPEREMRVYLASASLTGAIINAALIMDPGSRWYATGDSNVVIAGDMCTEQIDAPAGVTITASAESGQGTYQLLSGGTLIIK